MYSTALTICSRCHALRPFAFCLRNRAISESRWTGIGSFGPAPHDFRYASTQRANQIRSFSRTLADFRTDANFVDYGGPLTEILLLGIAATRADAKLQWKRLSPIGVQANPSRSDGLVTARPGRFMTCV